MARSYHLPTPLSSPRKKRKKDIEAGERGGGGGGGGEGEGGGGEGGEGEGGGGGGEGEGGGGGGEGEGGGGGGRKRERGDFSNQSPVFDSLEYETLQKVTQYKIDYSFLRFKLYIAIFMLGKVSTPTLSLECM